MAAGAVFGAALFCSLMFLVRSVSAGPQQASHDMNPGAGIWLTVLCGAAMGFAVETIALFMRSRGLAFVVVAVFFSGSGCATAAAQGHFMSLQYGWPTYTGICLVVAAFLAVYAFGWRYVERLGTGG